MDLLDTRQLRAFQELAKRESFTDAASHLNLTQSAVSHSIKALEGVLEVSLFERLGKKARLTTEGEALLPHVDVILLRMEKAIEDVTNHNQLGHGRIRIGSPPSISQYILPAVLREFLETFNQYDINVISADDIELIQRVEHGELDIVIAMDVNLKPKLKFTPLFNDYIELAMAPKYPLAMQDEITRSDLLAEKFIVCSKDSDSYKLVSSVVTRKLERLHPSLEVGSTTAIKEMAKIGLGVGLLPRWTAFKEINEGSLVFHPIPNAAPKRTWGVYQREETNNDNSMVEFIFTEMCRRTFANFQLQSETYLKN